jgi:uncharacterized protein YggU (UPF0235/DUF167 family)
LAIAAPGRTPRCASLPRCPGRGAPPTRADEAAGAACARASIAGVAEHADIRVRLTPRAARERVALGPDGAYAVRVTAPPVDGRANEALCRLIADRAGVARSRVSVVRGAKARDKVVRVEGIEAADLRARLLVG